MLEIVIFSSLYFKVHNVQHFYVISDIINRTCSSASCSIISTLGRADIQAALASGHSTENSNISHITGCVPCHDCHTGVA